MEFELFENFQLTILFAESLVRFFVLLEIFVRGSHCGVNIPILVIHPVFLRPPNVLKNFDVVRVSDQFITDVLCGLTGSHSVFEMLVVVKVHLTAPVVHHVVVQARVLQNSFFLDHTTMPHYF